MKTTMYGIRKIGDKGLPITYYETLFDELNIEYELSNQHFANEKLYLLPTREKVQAVLERKPTSFGLDYDRPSFYFDPEEYEVVEVEISII